jgi:hypothetical protein
MGAAFCWRPTSLGCEHWRGLQTAAVPSAGLAISQVKEHA